MCKIKRVNRHQLLFLISLVNILYHAVGDRSRRRYEQTQPAQHIKNGEQFTRSRMRRKVAITHRCDGHHRKIDSIRRLPPLNPPVKHGGQTNEGEGERQ